MNLRKCGAGLVTLCLLLFAAAEARNSLSPVVPLENQEYRSKSLRRDEALALYSAQQLQASFDSCKGHFPNGKPLDTALVSPALKAIALCSDSFAVVYSQASKTPLVVVERLSAAQLKDAQGEERTNQFYPDPRIPKSGRAELSDYRGQSPAVDRGHQAPAADAPNQRAMAQSFALSNMVPQDPANNRRSWSKVESDVRKFAKRARGNVFVYTGPIFDEGHETIGRNKVWKPTRLFKLVYDESSKRAWAYVLPNAEAHVESPMDYSAFVKATGLNLLDGVPVTGTAGRS
ncbi:MULTISPECIES: DNA/RNA non-specific endonuclease [Pandoraea]|uniref:DNA/RNA non-specific endonuclease n=1 Tax=Pandoraea TaxID=93217 RepID=UPI0003D20C0D|nr:MULTISPECIES: DNA/RNA non-specific endonuclease [Pandoraea]AHB77204.1 endonuclease [Pandoraea pnomenusa]